MHPDQNAERNTADNYGEQLALTGTGLLRRLRLAKLDDVIAHDACLLLGVAIEYASRVPFKRGVRFSVGEGSYVSERAGLFTEV